MYLEYHDKKTRTNYDVHLKKDECHYLIAEAAFRDGDYQQAFKHYEQYYVLNDGKIDREILKKLFIYSIELSDYDNSVQYFMDMFGDYIPDLLSAENYKLMQDALSLFIEKGWIELPCDIYEQLYEHNPDDEKILHHWVAALIKAKKVKKAQRLLAIARKKVS
jgi:tetratricopeptide (TPR) repeat protein